MKSVQELVKILTTSNLDQLQLIISGVTKSIKALAEFKTINLGDNGYLKMLFDDGSFLLIIPSDEIIMYSESSYFVADSITDEMVGKQEVIEFKGKKYKLENKNDYQYVIKLFKGDYRSIEGEVRFSDYVPLDGSDEFLSLGWIVRTGERADVNPKGVSISQIKVLNS